MEANEDFKLDWPFWKIFFLRVFLITRTPPQISMQPKVEWGAKGVMYCAVVLYLFFTWSIFFQGISPEQYFRSFDLSKPPIVLDGYALFVEESRGRRSYTEKYLLNEKKEPQYLVDTDFSRSELNIRKYSHSDWPNNLDEKRMIFSGYTHKTSPKLIILISQRVNDPTAGEWNNRELLDTQAIVKRFALLQTKSGYRKIYFTGFNTKFFFSMFLLSFLISLSLVCYDEILLKIPDNPVFKDHL